MTVDVAKLNPFVSAQKLTGPQDAQKIRFGQTQPLGAPQATNRFAQAGQDGLDNPGFQAAIQRSPGQYLSPTDPTTAQSGRRLCASC